MNAAQCSGKKACDFATARAEAKLLRRRKGAAAKHYHCPDCGYWHVGQQIGGPNLKARLRATRRRVVEDREARMEMASW